MLSKSMALILKFVEENFCTEISYSVLAMLTLNHAHAVMCVKYHVLVYSVNKNDYYYHFKHRV